MTAKATSPTTSTVRSVLIGIAAVIALLLVNWVLMPQVIGLFSAIERAGPFFFATTSGQLVADLILCFTSAFALMYLAQLRAPRHGTVIAGFMAFFGWAVYFMEVGYFTGMLHSEYPLWYELISFVKYPAAFALSFYVRRRS